MRGNSRTWDPRALWTGKRRGANLIGFCKVLEAFLFYFKKSFRGHGEKCNYWVFKGLLTMNKLLVG